MLSEIVPLVRHIPAVNWNVGWLYVGGAGILSYVAYRVYQRLAGRDQVTRERIEKARLQRDHHLGQLRESLRASERTDRDEIGDIALAELLEKLKDGELSPGEVLRVYQRRALAAHDGTNCLTDCLLEASASSKEANRPKGFLYGVPVSIKDSIGMKGCANPRGIVSCMENIEKDDCLIVKVLKAQGAVPFVRTTVPQMLMSYETANEITGVTTHPLDSRRTPGGSSGGEAALIASGGSILGIGSDIGGSIRVPCHQCGICGLKPTSSRISLKGQPPRGQTVVKACWGPMARDVESLAICMRALLVPMMFELDRSVPPIPFQEGLYTDTKALRIGYYESDGYATPGPAMIRGINLAKKVLKSQGHEVVPWLPPDCTFATQAFFTSISGDQGKSYQTLLGTDKVLPCLAPIVGSMKMSWPERLWNMFWSKDERVRGMLRAFAGTRSVYEWWTFSAAVQSYRQRFQDQWDKSKLDALICAPFLTTGAKHGCCENAMFSASFAVVYNVLDYPAGVVPVSKVTKQDIQKSEEANPEDYFHDYICDSMRDAEGFPVTVQCVAAPWQEEVCLRVMKDIERGVKLLSSQPRDD